MESGIHTGIALNFDNRLKEHNAGKNRFTKGHKAWRIIYAEVQPDWSAARTREKYLKTASGKKWLRKWLNVNGGKTGSLPA